MEKVNGGSKGVTEEEKIKQVASAIINIHNVIERKRHIQSNNILIKENGSCVNVSRNKCMFEYKAWEAMGDAYKEFIGFSTCDIHNKLVVQIINTVRSSNKPCGV